MHSRIIPIFLLLGILTLHKPGFADDLALVGGKVYSSSTARPIENGVILVHDGRIVAVGPIATINPPQGATVLDCKGLIVTSGFWNSHVHILTQGLMHAENLPAERISAQLAEMLTRWGFTTVFDIASVLTNTNLVRRRIESGEVRGPRILTVGDPFYPKGGTPIYVKGLLEANHIPSAEVESLSQAVERERRQFREGADGVKIFAASFAGDGQIIPMPLEIGKALVAEAHRAGKPAVAHPSNMEGIEIAVRSGVDVLAHTAPLSGPWSPALIKRMKANRMALVPTLTLFEVEGKKFGESPEDIRSELDTALAQLKAYSEAGGQVLFGTDVGYTDYFDTTEEFTLMARAGLDFRQILASLTTSPADRFGDSRSGRIARGFQADLVILDGDPAKDVTALARVRYTIRSGKVIYAADTPSSPGGVRGTGDGGSSGATTQPTMDSRRLPL
jgi:imidazolonepropionase-like amidohydrolase